MNLKQIKVTEPKVTKHIKLFTNLYVSIFRIVVKQNSNSTKNAQFVKNIQFTPKQTRPEIENFTGG